MLQLAVGVEGNVGPIAQPALLAERAEASLSLFHHFCPSLGIRLVHLHTKFAADLESHAVSPDGRPLLQRAEDITVQCQGARARRHACSRKSKEMIAPDQ